MAICHRRRKCKPEILYFRSWCLGESHLYVCAMPTNGSRRKMFLRNPMPIGIQTWHVFGVRFNNCYESVLQTKSTHYNVYYDVLFAIWWFRWYLNWCNFFAFINFPEYTNKKSPHSSHFHKIINFHNLLISKCHTEFVVRLRIYSIMTN